MPRRRHPARGAPPAMEIRYEFGFDAAHRFAGLPRGHPYARVHGHSFRAVVALRGTPQPPSGFIADFARLERACRSLRSRLDHAMLNDIEDLGQPSLEHLCLWIWKRLARRFPAIAAVTVRRDSLGQSCTYRGPGAERASRLR